MSTDDDNIALVRRIFHEGSSLPNTPAIVAEIFAVDFVCHGPPGVNHTHGGGKAGPEYCMLREAFTDVIFTIEEMGTEGDHVKCHFIAQAVQVAEFQGVKPSDHPISVSGITTFRVEDNQVKEGWGVLSWS